MGVIGAERCTDKGEQGIYSCEIRDGFYLLAVLVDKGDKVIKVVIQWQYAGTEVVEISDILARLKEGEVYCINAKDKNSVESFSFLSDCVTKININTGDLLTDERAVRIGTSSSSFLSIRGEQITSIYLAEVDNQIAGVYLTEVEDRDVLGE